MKRNLLTLFFALLGVFCVNAQSKLNKIEVNIPSLFVTPKAEKATFYQKPAANAAPKKEKGWDGKMYNCQLYNYEIIPATKKANGWYETSKGYLNPRQVKVAPNTPIADECLNGLWGGYQEDMDFYWLWRIGINRETGLALIEYTDMNDGYVHFGIGKVQNNVYAFPYHVYVCFEYDSERTDIKMEKVEEEGKISYNVKYGTRYARHLKSPNDETVSYTAVNLTRLPAKFLETLFADQIERTTLDKTSHTYYINGYLMNTPFYPCTPW